MTITKIEPQKKRKDRYSVFIDGGFAFGMDAVDVIRYKLKEGAEIGREQLAGVMENAVYAKALDKALRYLQARPRSRAEIQKKLSWEEVPDDIIQKVIDKLESYHYIDDETYARDIIASAARKQYGAQKVRQELWRRGIPRAMSDRLLAEDPPDERSAAKNVLAAKYPAPPADAREKKRCFDFLCRRGFSFDVAREAVQSFSGGGDEWAE